MPGCEAAGVVEEVADDVTSVAVGDRVAYTTGTGAYRIFDDIVQVHRDLDGRRTVGSVVLMP